MSMEEFIVVVFVSVDGGWASGAVVGVREVGVFCVCFLSRVIGFFDVKCE